VPSSVRTPRAPAAATAGPLIGSGSASHRHRRPPLPSQVPNSATSSLTARGRHWYSTRLRARACRRVAHRGEVPARRTWPSSEAEGPAKPSRQYWLVSAAESMVCTRATTDSNAVRVWFPDDEICQTIQHLTRSIERCSLGRPSQSFS
jgi:hypothetical protein